MVNQAKLILAKLMLKTKVENPLAFVAIVGALYGYTFLIDTGATFDWILGLFGSDINSIPNGLLKIIEKSTLVTGLMLGVVGGHTTDILKGTGTGKTGVTTDKHQIDKN